MTRTFTSRIPKLGRGDRTAPRQPSKPVPKDKLDAAAQDRADRASETAADKPKGATEIGGPEGPEPTRYGDWERGGICYDF
jgi:hypothetical protein